MYITVMYPDPSVKVNMIIPNSESTYTASVVSLKVIKFLTFQSLSFK